MHSRLGRVVHTMCVCLCLFVVLTARSAEPVQDPVDAVWMPQKLIFQYRSEGRMYRCDILEHKVRKILIQFGARDRIVVRRIACHDLGGAARLEVLMESPVAATPENIRAITQYDSEDLLIARVRGVSLPSAEDLEHFPAVWERVSIQRAPKVMLDAGDCALVQQLRRQVLPKMSVQVIKDIDRIDCSNAHPRLTVMALVATL